MSKPLPTPCQGGPCSPPVLDTYDWNKYWKFFLQDFPEPIKLEIKEEDKSVETSEYDSNCRVREMISQRLEDAVENMKMKYVYTWLKAMAWIQINDNDDLEPKELIGERYGTWLDPFSATAEKYPQLVRLLVESCLWLIRDWPGQKVWSLISSNSLIS